ncbi:MAG: hypothetical protein IJ071_02310 [Ruminococcus sp.]|nr:hypothetical protein [Ruminococcus sp.]
MSNIKYNEQEEAFELPYKLWGKVLTVRFYVDDEQTIMDNFTAVAQKLAALDGGKKKVAQLVADEGYYNGAAESLRDAINVNKAYVDIDEDGVVLCFTVDSSDGYLAPLDLELVEEQFEVIGWHR